MTQPQDKMRTEFEAAMRAEPYRWSRIDFDRETDFPGQSYAWVRTQAAWDAWQAACAQQSAQASQDALDAADSPEEGRYLVFNIGCIECGVSSNVVGRFGTEEKAKEVAAICDESLGWREGGQNSFEVFDLSAPQDLEYTAAIAAQGASNV